MARRQSRPVPPLVLPARLVPNFDDWGSPSEERKRARRNEWLEANDLTRQYFFEWVPAHLAERRRLAGMGPRPPARRKGPLPVVATVADLEKTRNPASQMTPNRTEGGSQMTEYNQLDEVGEQTCLDAGRPRSWRA